MSYISTYCNNHAYDLRGLSPLSTPDSILMCYRQVEVPIIPQIKGRDFYPNLAQVSKGIKIAYISPSIGVTPGGVRPLL